jgi:hypothetical protein
VTLLVSDNRPTCISPTLYTLQLDVGLGVGVLCYGLSIVVSQSPAWCGG